MELSDDRDRSAPLTCSAPERVSGDGVHTQLQNTVFMAIVDKSYVNSHYSVSSGALNSTHHYHHYLIGSTCY